jgi:hypothetical protein
MTLAEVSLPVTKTWGVAHALLFAAALAQRLGEVQSQHGDPRHVPRPRLLTDGRYVLTADILTECVPGGIVYSGFSHLDAGRFDEIAVVPIEEAVALLPPDPPMDE